MGRHVLGVSVLLLLVGCGSPSSTQNCRLTNEACAETADCCGTTNVCVGGTCQYPACPEIGDACSNPGGTLRGNCCSGECKSGTCVEPTTCYSEGKACGTFTLPCCSTLTCSGGKCVVAPTCSPASCPTGCCGADGKCKLGAASTNCGTGGAKCDVCSATEWCLNRVCQPRTPACATAGQSCAAATCCSGLVCAGNICSGASTSTLTWNVTDSCINGESIEFEFQDTLNNWYWPGGGNVYVALQGQSYTQNIQCKTGATVCIYAEQPLHGLVWDGVAINECYTCSQGTASTKLGCP